MKRGHINNHLTLRGFGNIWRLWGRKEDSPEDEDENFESVLPALPTEEKEIACTCQLT